MNIPERGKHESRWRFILDEPRDGPTNMAIDEVLASGCARGWSPPTLRLYRWTIPTVSLGYNQPIHGHVDLSTCHQRGVPVSFTTKSLPTALPYPTHGGAGVSFKTINGLANVFSSP
jgi:hypothetical protein